MTQKNVKNSFNEKLLKYDVELDAVDPEVINNYNKLNEKCDDVIYKIKARKSRYPKSE